MRANTFSALSAKGWMMVLRSWYSRKHCVAGALCQSLETAAPSTHLARLARGIWCGVPQLVTRAARLEASLQCIMRQRHNHSMAGPAAMQAALLVRATGAGKGVNSMTASQPGHTTWHMRQPYFPSAC